MRKFYTTLAIILFTTIAQSQIVNIPDANFKLELINKGIDTNNDGEIQVSEAQAITELQTSNSLINDVTGIEAFSNLTKLGFQQMPLTSLNISNLTNLTQLVCTDLQITSLDVSQLTNLTSLNCGGCINLTSLNVSPLNNLTYLRTTFCPINTLAISNLTNLTYLDCSSNNLNFLDVGNLTHLTSLSFDNNNISNIATTNLTNLIYLSFRNNNITNINLSNLSNLLTLDCSSNPINSIDLSPLTNLQNLYCSSLPINSFDFSSQTNLNILECLNNNLTSLNLSNQNNLHSLSYGGVNLISCNLNNLTNLETLIINGSSQNIIDVTTLINLAELQISNSSIQTINISSNPKLNRLSLNQNSNLTYLNMKNGNINYNTYIVGSPNLQYICADDQNIQYVQQLMLYPNYTNTQVNSYCTFVPGGVHNTITGTATLDINNNGCDSNDIHPKDLKININDGTIAGATFCNNNGTYSFFTLNGNFVLTPQFQNNYFTVNPVSTTLNFPLLDGSTQTLDFCITPNGIHNDIDVTILPIGNARPGFDANYQLVFKNKGNQTLSGSLNFTFDDSILDFVSASPSVNSQSVNNLNWNYSNLVPFESRTINLTLNVNSPMETPPVNIGDHLTYTAIINPVSGDETVGDNTFNLNQTVMGSFDPNDKVCLEGTTISPAKVGDYLHYVIRFQNSGTAPAENIVVKDMIDTTKLDIATLQLTAASHPQVTRITGNKAEFIFEGINLPAEQDNEPASHGFVAFKIKTKNNLVVGNSVANTADIYFDYNFPITTNTATTTITTLGINEFENKSVTIAPNPTKNEVTIISKDIITSIQLFDVQGRLIETKLNSATEAKLDVSNKLSGIYFVKVYTENGVKIEKIIKE